MKYEYIIKNAKPIGHMSEVTPGSIIYRAQSYNRPGIEQGPYNVINKCDIHSFCMKITGVTPELGERTYHFENFYISHGRWYVSKKRCMFA